MRKFHQALLALLICGFNLQAQSLTWSDNIASIIYSNCSSCHHSGGIGPFTLMSYQNAIDNAVEMQTAVTSGIMPPWHADPDCNHYANERMLDATEVAAINDWLNDGAPEGNPNNAPPPPVFNNGSQMTIIDQTIQIPEYTIQGISDEYRRFAIPSGLSQEEFINQIEYVPGNNSIVHHILLFRDSTNASSMADAADPLPGYSTSGAAADLSMIGGWAPGSSIFALPGNMGMRMPAGADYVIEIHYAPGSQGQSDQTKLNLKYSTANPVREIYIAPILYHFPPCLQEWPFVLPANSVTTLHEQTQIPGVFSLVSVFPHMHKVGQSFHVYMVSLLGDTTCIVDIPDWDFHWQGFYMFQKLMKIPFLATFYGEATYDNTTNNPDNPNDPPQNVYLGEQTTDEMMLAFFAYTEYQIGDENIILDSTLLNTTDPELIELHPYNVFPTLTTTGFEIQPVNASITAYMIRVYDVFGREIYNELISETGSRFIDLSDKADGLYLVNLSNGLKKEVVKVMKMK